MKFILTGANAGKTMKISHVQFTNGSGDWPGQLDKIGGLIKYLATFNAYPAGSKELEAAQKRDKESANGPSAILRGPGRSPESGLQADESSSGETGGQGAVAVEVPSEGSEADGGGASTGRVDSQSQDPKVMKVADAVKMLSPDVAENWTDDGLPMVSIVAESSGVIEVTRKDIELAAPGWTRSKALAEMAADL
jgi:hypothetical protein